MPRILLTTTSFQDTPGQHHELLDQAGYQIVRDRGPLTEARLLELIDEHGGFDGLLNGDDQITPAVIDAALNAPTPLRVIAKYGIGLDSIDVDYATQKHLPVLFTPGVNHTAVAEHAMGLMIALAKRFDPHIRATRDGQWKRKTGLELRDKTLGIVGLGRIGKALVERARPFGMTPIAFDPYFDEQFAAEHGVQRCETVDDLLANADVVSLHAGLTEQTHHLINEQSLARMKARAMLINTSRGALVDEQAVVKACEADQLWGYATDVLEQEPMPADHPFQSLDNVIVTPHIASRTFGNIERQGTRAVRNLINYLNGEADYIQANALSS
jgi:D-3-phosphoglycerate dehydrogenase